MVGSGLLLFVLAVLSVEQYSALRAADTWMMQRRQAATSASRENQRGEDILVNGARSGEGSCWRWAREERTWRRVLPVSNRLGARVTVTEMGVQVAGTRSSSRNIIQGVPLNHSRRQAACHCRVWCCGDLAEETGGQPVTLTDWRKLRSSTGGRLTS